MEVPITVERLFQSDIKSHCIVCQKEVASATGRQFFLCCVGAVYSADGGNTGASNDNMFAYMNVIHANDSAVTNAVVFHNVPEGQVRLYFCSKQCIYEFVDSVVNAIDNRGKENGPSPID